MNSLQNIKGASILFTQTGANTPWHQLNQQFNVQLSAVHQISAVHCNAISNSMFNFQLSTSCQPLSPLSSHQRPTLAFCPPANGWKLLEMLDWSTCHWPQHSLCTPTYIQPQSTLHTCIEQTMQKQMHLLLHLHTDTTDKSTIAEQCIH